MVKRKNSVAKVLVIDIEWQPALLGQKVRYLRNGLMSNRFKLEILYNDYSVSVKRFKTRQEAEWFARNEGDHVWDYNIKELDKDE